MQSTSQVDFNIKEANANIITIIQFQPIFPLMQISVLARFIFLRGWVCSLRSEKIIGEKYTERGKRGEERGDGREEKRHGRRK